MNLEWGFSIAKDALLHGEIPMKLRHLIRLLCFYLIPPITLGIILVTGREAAIELGAYAIALFFIVLLSSPLSQLLPKIKILSLLRSLQKELGVLSFWLVMIHGLGILYFEELLSLFAIRPFLKIDDLYFWGLIGFLGMFYLGVTSHTWAIRLLRKFWKKSHVIIVYPTMTASIIHASLADEGGTWITLGSLYILLKITLIVKRGKIPQ